MKYIINFPNTGEDLISEEIMKLWNPYEKEIIGNTIFFSVGDRDGKSLRLSMKLNDFKNVFKNI